VGSNPTSVSYCRQTLVWKNKCENEKGEKEKNAEIKREKSGSAQQDQQM
jgi:hypothetical protein